MTCDEWMDISIYTGTQVHDLDWLQVLNKVRKYVGLTGITVTTVLGTSRHKFVNFDNDYLAMCKLAIQTCWQVILLAWKLKIRYNKKTREVIFVIQ